MDAVLDHDFVLDGSQKLIYLAKKGSGHSPLQKTQMVLQERVFMAPHSEIACVVSMRGPSEKAEGSFLFTPSNKLPSGISVNQFASETNGIESYHIHIENRSWQPRKLNKGLVLGSVDFNCQIVGKIAAIATQDSKEKKNLSEILAAIDVEKQHAHKLKELLAEFADMIATTIAELGSFDKIKHQINTEVHLPIRQRPYRTTPKHKDEIKKQITEMLQANIIRPSTSPWAAPVILVEKKSGDQRFCVDYRKLNKITKKDSYPLPRIDETLDSLHGMKYFSTLDLLAGYWQIELEEKDKEKTAFITGNELYEFNRMPFGLCNTPATFQRSMNHVLRTVLGEKALVYLDDIVVFSDTPENHLINLREVLTLLKTAGLKIKLQKCKFMKKSVEFLGHIISGEGISPNPSTIKAIVNYAKPTSVDEVRSFLGLAGYYRRFIPHFGSIAKPLTRKTHKDVINEPFNWTNEDQKAFDKLRTCLITPPILAYPDFSKDFLLFTDASNYGVGAVLSQTQNEKEVVIAYASRQLKQPELKYATIEKEALAVVFAIKQFKQYLTDRPFLVISDHRPLQWLENQKDNNGRLGRWAVTLSSLNYRIVYRPGKMHQNADSLSRLKIVAIKDSKDGATIKPSKITELQTRDALCQNISNYLKTGILEHNYTKMPIWGKQIDFSE